MAQETTLAGNTANPTVDNNTVDNQSADSQRAPFEGRNRMSVKVLKRMQDDDFTIRPCVSESRKGRICFCCGTIRNGAIAERSQAVIKAFISNKQHTAEENRDFLNKLQYVEFKTWNEELGCEVWAPLVMVDRREVLYTF